MKKTFVLIAIAVIAALASCEKLDEEGMGTAKKSNLIFTATILNTKTSINASTGKVDWEADDEITITDASSVSVVYEVASISEGRATFTKKAGESGDLGAGPYTAVYGTAPSAAQVYGAEVNDLPMTASSATTSLTFSVSCGLMEITLTKDGESISSVAVSDGANTYTLTCASAQDIAGGKMFHVVLPTGNYTSFIFTNENGGVCTKTGGSVTIAANQIQPISFSKLSFTYIVHNATELYAAIAACQDGDKIMLAEGTYTATETFAITKNIALEGGYGASPAIGDVADPQNHKATLDGDSSYRVMLVNAPIAAGKSVQLSGLVLQNGTFTGNAGGLMITRGNVTANRVIIQNNTATGMGAGFVITGANAKASFFNCTVANNTSGTNGSNYVYDGADVSFDQCVITGNESKMGGGIYIYNNNAQGVKIQITNSELSNNIANAGRGGAIYLRGDGANSGVTMDIANCTMYGNSCTSWGAAIDVYSKSGYPATANIFNCTVTGNSTSYDGASVVAETVSTIINIYNSIVSGNTTKTSKNDIYQNNGTINQEGCVNGGTVSDYLASTASSKDGFLTKAFKVKTAATTAGMDLATLKSRYTGGDTDFENTLGLDQWGATRSGTTAGACVMLAD